MVKQYYFSVQPYFEMEDEADPADVPGLSVTISPKDYTDEHHCCYDNHIGDEIDPIIGQLPFILSEDAECEFSVWDLDEVPGLIPASQIKNVVKALKKVGFIEKDPDSWLD